MAIELDRASREALVSRIQTYLLEELGVELGSFDVEFLLDFFAAEAGWMFYNQGLADARQALQAKIDEFSEVIYELEQRPPDPRG